MSGEGQGILSAMDVIDLIEKIRSEEYSHIDSRVLATLVEITLRVGLKKADILDVRIGDVIDEDGNPLSSISRFSKEIAGENLCPQISTEVKTTIHEYLDYLRENEAYRSTSEAPLFPQKDGTAYGGKKLGLDLKKYVDLLDQSDKKMTLDRIRQAGIREYYSIIQVLKKLKVDQAVREAAKFARVSKKEAEGILKDSIQKAGTRRPLDFDKWAEKIRRFKDISEEQSELDEKLDRHRTLTSPQIEILSDIIEEGVIESLGNLSEEDIRFIEDLVKQGTKNVLEEEEEERLCSLLNSFDSCLKRRTIISNLQKNTKLERDDLLWAAESSASFFDKSNLEEIEEVKIAYFNAVDIEFSTKKTNSILKDSFLKSFHEKGVGFNVNTGKPYILPRVQQTTKIKATTDLMKKLDELS